MRILIPMAGLGTRFETEEAKKELNNFDVQGLGEVPKPYIKINGKSMIEIVIESLNIAGKIILIINESHLENNEVFKIINNIKNKYNNIIVVNGSGNLKGTATTAIEAKKHIRYKENLMLINSDQFFIKNFSKNFIKYIQSTDSDGTIVTYNSKSLKNSFAILDKDKNVKKIIEKPEKYIPNSFATTGVNFWRKGKSFIEGCESMIDKKITIKGEYYISPIYNENILNGEKFDIFPSNNVKLVRTPKDLLKYLK